MLPVKGKYNLENLIEMVPELISKVSSKMGCCQDKKENPNAEEDTKTEKE